MREGINAGERRYAFVGNMNNMPFVCAREIKARGIEVVLFVDVPQKVKLDRPEAFDLTVPTPYPEWIRDISKQGHWQFLKLRFAPLFYKDLIRDLNGFDSVVLNGNWIALAPYLSKEVRVFTLIAGFEVDVLADPDSVEKMVSLSLMKRPWLFPLKFLLRSFFHKVVQQHRDGIARSDGINYYPKGISIRGDEIIEELLYGKKYKRLNLRGLPTEDFVYTAADEKKDEFTIINFTRFFFLNDRLDNKRNDIMLYGIGMFVKEIGYRQNVKIIFFAKGDQQSLDRAREIIEECGYTQFVTWHEEVTKEDLFINFVPRADILFDQLGGQWVGAGLYSMLIGRPLIANGRPDVFESITGESSPICQATSPEEVSFWLKKLYVDRSEVNRIGRRSRDWVAKHYNIDDTIDFFIDD